MNIQKQIYLVVGMGKSGIAAAKLLNDNHCNVCLYDGNENIDLEAVRQKHELPQSIKMIKGEIPEKVKNDTTVLVLSPGVPTDLPWILEMKDSGIVIWGEIELAYVFGKGRILAITGTNGKTTTTTLVGEIMKNAFPYVDVVGNIGIPYTEVVDAQVEDHVTVCEISSFQLETVETFRPSVSAILNIQPDHLDRHHTMENYIAAKEAISKNQTKDDTCVLNYDNEDTRDFGKRCPAKVVYFSSTQKLSDGYFHRDGVIYESVSGKERALMHVSDMNLVGMCNVENVMAAIAMSKAMGVSEEIILDTVKHFKAVEHRIEFVATKNGVDYYNDSKGTNPDAAIQGIRAMSKPTILIGGGYDKGSEYDTWIEAFEGKVKLLVLIGVTREKIAETAKRHGMNQYVFADSFEEAFEICVKNAQSGDAVLLSPACASWGMFPNYEERGRLFKKLVNEIAE